MENWSRRSGFTGVRLRSRMEPHESEVLGSLVVSLVRTLTERDASAPRDELAELTGMRPAHSAPPEDPVLARLLPDFHRPEPRDAEEGGLPPGTNGVLRSLYEPSIIDDKVHALMLVAETMPRRGGSVSLSEQQAEVWLMALNDLRLALGTIIGVEVDDPAEPGAVYAADDADVHDDEDDLPDAGRRQVYHWLTFMQDSLCQVLMD